MVKIFEHQREAGSLKNNEQSRTIECESFEQYVKDLKNDCIKYHSLPKYSKIKSLKINSEENLLVLEFLHPVLNRTIIHSAEVIKI